MRQIAELAVRLITVMAAPALAIARVTLFRRFATDNGYPPEHVRTWEQFQPVFSTRPTGYQEGVGLIAAAMRLLHRVSTTPLGTFTPVLNPCYSCLLGSVCFGPSRLCLVPQGVG